MVKDGNLEGAKQAHRDIGAILELHTPGERDKILFRLRSDMSSHVFMTQKLIEDGRVEYANKLQELISNGNP